MLTIRKKLSAPLFLPKTDMNLFTSADLGPVQLVLDKYKTVRILVPIFYYLGELLE